jgi:hypothetical protein
MRAPGFAAIHNRRIQAGLRLEDEPMDPTEILLALNDENGLPTEALRAASRRRDEMVPLFLAEIERFCSKGRSDDDDPALFFAFLLLGEWREKSAYRPLARMLRRPGDDLDAIFGDAIVETAHRIMTQLYDGDPAPFFEICLDPAADQYVRATMFDALAILAVRGALSRDALGQFLESAFDRLQPRAESFVWIGWLEAIEALGLEKLKPSVERAFDEGWADESVMGFEDFERGLAHAIAHPEAPFPSYSSKMDPWDDTIAELSTWHCYTEEGMKEQARRLAGADVESDEEWWPSSDRLEPYVNEYKSIGRNDPCPCGSGKKYKKCCLE